MAWNEPGGNGNKDPWNNGGNNSGPPELDEVFRQLQQKLNKLFGGSSSGSNNSGIGSIGLIAFLTIIALLWGLSGIYVIDEGKRGLVLRFGEYHHTSMPGLNWRPRFIDNVMRVDIAKQRIVEIGYRMGQNGQSTPAPQEALMLTEDENIVNIRLAVQYQVADPIKYMFAIYKPDNTLKQAAESALREVVGRHSMDFILTKGRTQLVQEIQPLMQEILNEYHTGLNVTTVNLQDAQPPEEVQEAFADVIKAREDKQRLKNEADAYAKDIIPRARGAAARQAQEAEAYTSQVESKAEGEASRFDQLLVAYNTAPEITQQRLYIETMERVLKRTNKVMVDVDQGNSLLYLPLDKMISPTTTSNMEQHLPTRTFQNFQESPPETKIIPRDHDRLRTRGTR